MACDGLTSNNSGRNNVHQPIVTLSDLSEKVQERPQTFIKPSIQAS